MWYAPHDGVVLFATSSKSRKVRNLEGDPRATLVLHDSRPGYEVCGASIVGCDRGRAVTRCAVRSSIASRDATSRRRRRAMIRLPCRSSSPTTSPSASRRSRRSPGITERARARDPPVARLGAPARDDGAACLTCARSRVRAWPTKRRSHTSRRSCSRRCSASPSRSRPSSSRRLIHDLTHVVWDVVPDELGWSEPCLVVRDPRPRACRSPRSSRCPAPGTWRALSTGGLGAEPIAPIALTSILTAALATLSLGLVLGPEAPLIALGLGLGALRCG
jgi:hypothetical protein